MEDPLHNFGSILERIRTPLTLAGLAFLILYEVFRQILGLNIFSNVGAQGTTNIVSMLIRSVFWISVLALVLGVGSYIVSLIIRRRLSSSLELVDARVDTSLSDSRDNPDAGKDK